MTPPLPPAASRPSGTPPRTDDSPSPGPRWILHPALIAVAWVLEVALANKIEPAGFARSLGVAVVAAVALTLICWLLTRDRWLGGLLAAALVLASISLLPIYFAWEALRAIVGPSATVVILALVLAGVVALPAIQRIRVRRGAMQVRKPATSVLNQLSAVLVVVVIVFYAGPDLPRTISNALRSPEPVAVAPTVAELPDIYIVLVDGYPRADVLSRLFGIDNAPFIADLGALGFEVNQHSHSNYVFTQLTLASMFEMRHLDQIPALDPFIGLTGGQINPLRDALIQGRSFTALHAAGYEIVATLPGYDTVALRGVADRVLEHGEMNDLERDVLKRTWLLDPLALLVPGIYSSPQHDRILHEFDDLEALATEARDDPMFAWIHIPAPHLPLVLDAEGDALVLEPRRFDPETVAGFGYTDAQFRALYADELSYVNARLLRAIELIQSSNARPDPVIIVMSDHGYYYDPNDLQARFGNFFAAFTPQLPGLFADGPTPVNVMAELLNGYLGTEFATSSDRYFTSPGVRRLLELVEVPDPEVTEEQ